MHKNVIPVVPSRRKKESTPPLEKVKVEKARETSEKVWHRRAPSPPLKPPPPLEAKRSKDSGGVRGREKKGGSNAYEKGRTEEEGSRRSRHLRSDLELPPQKSYERAEEEVETPRSKRRRDEEATRGGSSVAGVRKEKGVKERVQDGKGMSGGARREVKGEGIQMQRKPSEGRVEKRSDDRGLDDLTEKLKLRKERFGLEAEGGKEVERSARKRRWND